MKIKSIAAGAVAAATLATGGTLAYTATAQASTAPQTSTRGLVHAIVTGATVGIDGVTYRAEPVSVTSTGHYPTRGYTRTCRAFARWNAAGIPSYRQLRTLAHDAAVMGDQSLANDALKSGVAYLVLSVVGGTDGSGPAVVVGHDCSNDA